MADENLILRVLPLMNTLSDTRYCRHWHQEGVAKIELMPIDADVEAIKGQLLEEIKGWEEPKVTSTLSIKYLLGKEGTRSYYSHPKQSRRAKVCTYTGSACGEAYVHDFQWW